MNNLKLTKKKDLILAAVIIVIAIVMYIIMNQMQSDNGEIVKITVDGNVYGTYSLTKNQEIEIKTDKGKNIVWIHSNTLSCRNYLQVPSTENLGCTLPSRVTSTVN